MRVLKKLIEYGPADRLKQVISDELSARPDGAKKGKRPLRILDIGSGGAGYWGDVLTAFGGQIELTLFDPKFPANFHELEQLSTVRHLSGLAPEGLAEIESDYFDICTAFDLIEHLSREDGYLLLYEIDRLTCGISIVFTPNGFVWQAPSSNNPFNAHISGWKPSELREMGWHAARGHTGFRRLFGPYGLSRLKSKPWIQLSYLSAIFVRFVPQLAFAFSCVRRHSEHEKNLHIGLAG